MSKVIPYDRGYDSPGVDYFEREVIPLITGPDQLAVGIVGTAPQGPIGNTMIYNEKQLVRVFGDPTVDHLGLLAAKFALKFSRSIIFNRVVSGDAKVGAAADGLFQFSTKTMTDKFNDYTVKLTYDKATKVIEYKLLDPNNRIVENVSGFTLDKSAKSFIGGEIFDNKSDILSIKVLGDLPDEDTGFEDISLQIKEGSPGTNITKDEIIGDGATGIKAFESAETVDISTLIVPGWTDDAEVITALDSLTKNRGDVQVIIDTPHNLTPQEAVNWTNGQSGMNDRLDNGWFAVYYPWVKVKVDGKVETVPPSVVVAAQWAYNDSVANCWFAPAGYGNDSNSRGRGYLSMAVDTERELGKEDRDLLYGEGNVINPITKFIGKGIILFGNRTTKRTTFGDEPESMMSSLNIRRLCNYIRKFVISKSFNELFNPNDRFTWNNWKLTLEPEFRRIQINRGLEAFKVVMDETTVSSEDTRHGRMPGIIYIKPIRAAEYIPITFVVTDNDVYFNEGQPFEVGSTERSVDTGDPRER